MVLKEQLKDLGAKYPEGLNRDVRYLAGLVNYSDAYRRQEIGAAIRWWENNLRHGCSNPEEVKVILSALKSMIDYKE